MTLRALKPTLGMANLARVATSTSSLLRERGRPWMRRRARWFSDHPLCVLCDAAGRTALAQELDHIVPLWAGGSGADDNLQGLCIECHRAKTAREAGERHGK
jgi:5-methylcytosine-specific restriction endonuclease McrA